MRNLWITILLGAPLFGQFDSGSLTVTATRAMVLQPDQVAFTASVAAGANSTMDDILASVAPVGLTAANLTGISGGAVRLTYNFAWLVPIAKINETAAALQSARIAFQVTGAGVSDDLQSPNSCSTSDLLADAQTQARKMAAAIGG